MQLINVTDKNMITPDLKDLPISTLSKKKILALIVDDKTDSVSETLQKKVLSSLPNIDIEFRNLGKDFKKVIDFKDQNILLILDLIMDLPDCDIEPQQAGRYVIENLRKDDKCKDVPVLLWSITPYQIARKNLGLIFNERTFHACKNSPIKDKEFLDCIKKITSLLQ